MSEKNSVVYHNVMASYPPGVLDTLPGVPTYTARALAMSNPGDMVILPELVRPNLPWVLRHYQRVGLPVASHILFGDYKNAAGFPAETYDMSVFLFGEDEHRVRPNQCRRDAVIAHNNKNTFLGRICREVGAPTPETHCYDSAEAMTFLPMQFPFYAKAAESASGQDVFRCENEAELYDAIAKMAEIQPQFQLQKALPEGTVFLNVQYRSEAGKAVRGPVTRQILTGNCHDGNIHPSRVDTKQVWEVTDPLAEYAVAMGLEDIWAYDAAWLPDGTVLIIECNPRANGCTYFSEVARKLDVYAWEARNVKFMPGTYEGFDLADLEYNSGQGIIVVNWGCVGFHKLGLFVAGTSDQRAGYLREFDARFNQRTQIRAVS